MAPIFIFNSNMNNFMKECMMLSSLRTGHQKAINRQIRAHWSLSTNHVHRYNSTSDLRTNLSKYYILSLSGRGRNWTPAFHPFSKNENIAQKVIFISVFASQTRALRAMERKEKLADSEVAGYVRWSILSTRLLSNTGLSTICWKISYHCNQRRPNRAVTTFEQI